MIHYDLNEYYVNFVKWGTSHSKETGIRRAADGE